MPCQHRCCQGSSGGGLYSHVHVCLRSEFSFLSIPFKVLQQFLSTEQHSARQPARAGWVRGGGTHGEARLAETGGWLRQEMSR